MQRNLTALIATMALAACGGSSEEPPPSPADEGVFDDMTGTLDRAQATEQQLQDGAAARRRALEQQED